MVEFKSNIIRGIQTNDQVFTYRYSRVIDNGQEAYSLHAVFYETVNLFGFGIGKPAPRANMHLTLA